AAGAVVRPGTGAGRGQPRGRGARRHGAPAQARLRPAPGPVPGGGAADHPGPVAGGRPDPGARAPAAPPAAPAGAQGGVRPGAVLQRNLRRPAPYRDAEAVEQALAALEKSSPAGEETLLLRVLDRSRKGRPREAEAALGEVRSKLPADQAPLALARGYELLGQ